MKDNIFENIKIDKRKEQFIEIVSKNSVKIEKIVSNGQSSKENFWYDQEENEFIILLEGEAILEFENEEVNLKAGDYLNINAHVKHRVKYTSQSMPTIWLAVFY